MYRDPDNRHKGRIHIIKYGIIFILFSFFKNKNFFNITLIRIILAYKIKLKNHP